MRRVAFAAAIGGLLMAAGLSAPASAAPVGGAALAAGAQTSTGGVETVHYRRYRHCHWRNGRRWCHGGVRRYGYGYGGYDGYGYGYGYRPGINLYIGPRYGHRHHRRRHH